MDTGLHSLKGASKKVVYKSGKFLGNKIVVSKSNGEKTVKQEPVEATIIPPEERDEILNKLRQVFTAWKVSKYGVISDPYFPVFVLNTENPNTGKYRPEITPYLDTFDVVIVIKMEHYKISKLLNYSTVSKFVTKMDQSKWFIKPISC